MGHVTEAIYAAHMILTNWSPWQRCKHQTFATYCYFIHLWSQMVDPSWWFSMSLKFLGVKIHFNCDPCVQGRSPLMEIWESHRGVWMNHHPLNSQSSSGRSMTIRPPWIQFLCLMRVHIHCDESQWGEPGWCRFPAGCPQDKLLKGPDSSFSMELQGGNSGKSAVCWQSTARWNPGQTRRWGAVFNGDTQLPAGGADLWCHSAASD